jgi:D-3-phosphoglycerate dehydrogenase
MILDATRGQYGFRHDAQLGFWSRGILSTRKLKRISDLSIGVVGYGVIGKKMVSTLRAFAGEVKICDPILGRHGLSLDNLAADCDIVTLHCSYSKDNFKMINKSWLAKAKDGLILINTARGNLIDLDAARKALDAGKLSYLGIDVYPEEPYSLMNEVRGRPGLNYTPHSSGYYESIHDQISANLLHYVEQFLSGSKLDFEIV